MASNKAAEPVAGQRLIWDLPTRLVHWAIAACFVGSWVTAEAGFDWTEVHFTFGYCTLGLILFRLLWGFVGPKHARFGSFLKGPNQVWQHVRHLWRPVEHAGPPEQVAPSQPAVREAPGHNALGGWAVVLLLLALAVQAGTGLFLTDDIFYAGPYNPLVSADTASWLASIHHQSFTVLQGLVALHLLAIAWYHFRLKQNLLMPMLSGKKSVSRVTATDAIESSAVWRALGIALLVGFSVCLLVYLAPEPVVADYF